MKVEIKQKQLKDLIDNDTIVKVGYFHLQNLLRYEQPMFYIRSNDGWCCDVYRIEKHNVDMSIETTYIITGYNILSRVQNNNTYQCNYFDCQYYENLAKDRINQYIFHSDSNDCKNAMRTLIYEMISAVKRVNSNKVV